MIIFEVISRKVKRCNPRRELCQVLNNGTTAKGNILKCFDQLDKKFSFQLGVTLKYSLLLLTLVLINKTNSIYSALDRAKPLHKLQIKID